MARWGQLGRGGGLVTVGWSDHQSRAAEIDTERSSLRPDLLDFPGGIALTCKDEPIAVRSDRPQLAIRRIEGLSRFGGEGDCCRFPFGTAR